MKRETDQLSQGAAGEKRGMTLLSHTCFLSHLKRNIREIEFIIRYQMGNKGNVSLNDYQLVSSNPQFKILRNRSENKLYEAYTVVLQEGQNHQNQFRLWGKRSMDFQNVVKVYNVIVGQKAKCSDSKIIYVITERMQSRLKDRCQIGGQEGIAISRAILNGCRQIAQNFQTYFQFEQSCVGFNEEGRARVWINPNLGLNQANFGVDSSYVGDQGKEDGVVHRVLDCLRKKVVQDQLIIFDRYTKQLRRPLTFVKTLRNLDRMDKIAQSILSLNKQRNSASLGMQVQSQKGQIDVFSGLKGATLGIKQFVERVAPYEYKINKRRQFKKINIFEQNVCQLK